MQPVTDDRPADGASDLLIGVGQHALGDEVLRVQAVVAEEAVEAAVQIVRPGPRDRLHLHTERAALRDVEQVGDDLELRDRLAAEARLAEAAAGHLLRDLLPVQIELELPVADARRVVHGVGRDAAHLHRQLHPVAALERKFGHLSPVDVAAHLVGADVHERRLAGDGDGLLERGDPHRERNGPVLADQQFDVGHHHGRKAREFGGDLVAGGRQAAQAILAALVADRREHTAGVDVRRGDGHTRERAFGLVRHGAQDGRLLSRRRSRTQPQARGQAVQHDPNAHAPSSSEWNPVRVPTAARRAHGQEGLRWSLRGL